MTADNPCVLGDLPEGRVLFRDIGLPGLWPALLLGLLRGIVSWGSVRDALHGTSSLRAHHNGVCRVGDIHDLEGQLYRRTTLLLKKIVQFSNGLDKDVLLSSQDLRMIT